MSDYSPTHWLKDQPILNDALVPTSKILPFSSVFKPEKWLVDKNTLRSAIDALQAGLDHTRYVLAEHDSSLGRTTRKNKSWAETIESDIRAMENSIKQLKVVEVENSTHYP